MTTKHVTTHKDENPEVASSSGPTLRTYRPKVDVCEAEDAFGLWADLPGVDEESVSVRLEEDVLLIEGQISTDGYDGLQARYTEYGVGNFAHRFSVSSDIDADRIEAKLEHGVLELRLPKSERARRREIQISS